MRNVQKMLSPSKITEVVNREIQNGYEYPVLETSDPNQDSRIIMNPEIGLETNKTDVKSYSFSGGTHQNPINLEFSIFKAFYNSNITGNTEEVITIAGDGVLSLKELVKLAEYSSRLALAAQVQLKTMLLSYGTKASEAGILQSGEFLYSNIVNPESFKYVTDNIVQIAAESDIKPLSEMQNLIDNIKTTNYILDKLNIAGYKRFIDFCVKISKNVEAMDVTSTTVVENKIRPSQAEPAIVAQTEAPYNQVGTEEVKQGQRFGDTLNI